jgi:hypothetical protein
MLGTPLLQNLATNRHRLMLAPFIAVLPVSLVSGPAQAVDPNETQVTLPDQLQWEPALPGAPAQSGEMSPLFGATDKPELYAVLIKWDPP